MTPSSAVGAGRGSGVLFDSDASWPWEFCGVAWLTKLVESDMARVGKWMLWGTRVLSIRGVCKVVVERVRKACDTARIDLMDFFDGFKKVGTWFMCILHVYYDVRRNFHFCL